MSRIAKRRPWPLVAVTVLVGAMTGPAALARPAQEAAAAATEASLLAAEDRLFAAKIAHDLPAIARSMADEAIYTHGSGRVQTKAEYLKDLADGRIAYRSIEPVGRVARVSGNLGVTHGTLDMAVGERRMQDGYLAAYVRRQGRWQLLFWQTSPGPSASSPGPR